MYTYKYVHTLQLLYSIPINILIFYVTKMFIIVYKSIDQCKYLLSYIWQKSITCSSIAKVALYKQMIMPIIQLAAAAAAVDMCDMVN